MYIRLRELVSAIFQCMAYIAIYVNLLHEPYVSNNYDKFAERKVLLSSDVEVKR